MWGTVTSTDPVTVLLDGDTTPVSAFALNTVSIGGRVWCQIEDNHVIVFGQRGYSKPVLDAGVFSGAPKGDATGQFTRQVQWFSGTQLVMGWRYAVVAWNGDYPANNCTIYAMGQGTVTPTSPTRVNITIYKVGGTTGNYRINALLIPAQTQ